METGDTDYSEEDLTDIFVDKRKSSLATLQQILPEGYYYNIPNENVKPVLDESHVEKEWFCAEVRCKLLNKDEALQWLEDFNKSSGSKYTCHGTYRENSPKVVFKKRFKCEHNTGASLPCSKTKTPHEKHTGCPATVSVTVKNSNMKRSSDLFLKDFPCVIKINYLHNHQIGTMASLKYRSPTKEVAMSFLDLFRKGHSPTSALSTHQFELEQLNEENYYKIVADGAQSPTLWWCYNVYRKTFGRRYQMPDSESMYQSLVECIHEYNQSCGSTCANMYRDESDLNVVICSPLMKRVHELLPSSANLCFMVSAGMRDTRSHRVFVILAPSVAGGLPLGILITNSDSESSIIKALEEWKKILPEKAFFGKGFKGPNIFITGDRVNERNSLRQVFPGVVLLLCVFHVLQAVWRFVWNDKHQVLKLQDKCEIYHLFTDMLYAQDVDTFYQNYEKAMSNTVLNQHPVILKYFSDMMQRTEEWTLCFRKELITCDNITDDYSETAVRVVKDVILGRTRTYNPLQLFHFLTSKLDLYFQRRISAALNDRVANLSKSRHYIKEEQLSSLSAKKLTYSLNDYEVTNSESGNVYIVNAHLEICSCQVGLYGSPCQHQLYVHREFKLFPQQLLNCNGAAKIRLHKIMTGSATEFPQDNSDTLHIPENPFVCPATLDQEIATLDAFNDMDVDYIDNNDDFDLNLNTSSVEKEISMLGEVPGSLSERDPFQYHYLQKKDIQCLKKAFSADEDQHLIFSVNESLGHWVQSCCQMENSPILLYRPENYCDIDKGTSDGFAIIIMTEYQKHIFRASCKKVICVDRSQQKKGSCFHVTVLLVMDEYKLGFPTAFCISAKLNKSIILQFFDAVKQCTGCLETDCFMSDGEEYIYDAWKEVMGTEPKWLWNAWYVGTHWRNQMHIFKGNTEKCDEVYNTLRALLECESENVFKLMIKTFIMSLKSETVTNDLGKYVEQHYAPTASMWAYCYRKDLGLGTSMHLEVMHRTLAFCTQEGLKKSLDKFILILMKLVRDKILDRLSRIGSEKLSLALANIAWCHKIGLKIPTENVIPTSEKEWDVKSAKSAEIFRVTLDHESCPEHCSLICDECDICVHMFTCTCCDNLINANLCDHIHAIGIACLVPDFASPDSVHIASNSESEGSVDNNQNLNKTQEFLQQALKKTKKLCKKLKAKRFSLSDYSFDKIIGYLNKSIEVCEGKITGVGSKPGVPLFNNLQNLTTLAPSNRFAGKSTVNSLSSDNIFTDIQPDLETDISTHLNSAFARTSSRNTQQLNRQIPFRIGSSSGTPLNIKTINLLTSETDPPSSTKNKNDVLAIDSASNSPNENIDTEPSFATSKLIKCLNVRPSSTGTSSSENISRIGKPLKILKTIKTTAGLESALSSFSNIISNSGKPVSVLVLKGSVDPETFCSPSARKLKTVKATARKSFPKTIRTASKLSYSEKSILTRTPCLIRASGRKRKKLAKS